MFLFRFSVVLAYQVKTQYNINHVKTFKFRETEIYGLPWQPYFGGYRVAYEAEDVPDGGDHAVYEHDLGRRVPQDVVGRQVGELGHGRRATRSQHGRDIRIIHLKAKTTGLVQCLYSHVAMCRT